MNVNKNTTHLTYKSDLARVDAHKIQPGEYDDVPELIDEDMSRGVFKRAGRPVAQAPSRSQFDFRSRYWPVGVKAARAGRRAWRRYWSSVRLDGSLRPFDG